MDFLIITGMSGAGRTQATKFLEDMGYFCMDNIPTKLLPKFGELFEKNEMQLEKFALVMDVRNGNFVDDLYNFTDKMEQLGITVRIIFFDCSDKVLISRHKENKKLHPLASDGDNEAAIHRERTMLLGLKEKADTVIDTTELSVWDLKKRIQELFRDRGDSKSIIINVVSFGYKYGTPANADVMFDVRFLPNPYYVPELRGLTGQDEAVFAYVVYNPNTKMFLDRLTEMLEMLIPQYKNEGKEVLVVAIGCTGGRHRSVAVATELSSMLSAKGHNVTLSHRDVEKSN